jgi:hypothetical protein
MSFDRRLRDGLDRAASPFDPDVEGSLRSVLVRRRRRVRVRQAAFALATAAVVMASVIGMRIGLGERSADEASSAEGAQQIVGRYEVALSADDSAGVSPSLAGRWRIQLNADGTVELAAPDTFRAEQNPLGISYAATESAFRTNIFYDNFCLSVGSYTWHRTGSELVFEVLDDACEIRRVLLTSQPWARSD